jgi:hypothetical protein
MSERTYKFKVGDRVKVVYYPDCVNEDMPIGSPGTVVEISEFFIVRLDGRPDNNYFKADELELLVEPKPEPENDMKKKIFTPREHQ